MAFFKDDTSFEYEFRRYISHARYRGSDVGELLELLKEIRAGDLNSWHDAFLALAQRTEKSAGASTPVPPSVALREGRADRWFAASNYYRAADFFLHGHPKDAHINELWMHQARCFDNALAFLGNGERHTLTAGDFKVPIIYFKAANALKIQGPRPTVIAINGFDGSMEEMMHITGFAALDRGYNFIVMEGPGQCTVRREQDLGFIHDWERVVKPVVDFALQQTDVDPKLIALYGYSLGGYLCVRAAAFEHRIAAAVAIDGVYSFGAAMKLPPQLMKLLENGEVDKFNEICAKVAFDPATPTQQRWSLQQGLWTFKTNRVSELLKAVHQMDLSEVIHNVQCPVFVGDAEEDIFFKGQPELVAAALGGKATLRVYTTVEGAGVHCQVGAASLLNMDVFEWLEKNMIGAEANQTELWTSSEV